MSFDFQFETSKWYEVFIFPFFSISFFCPPFQSWFSKCFSTAQLSLKTNNILPDAEYPTEPYFLYLNSELKNQKLFLNGSSVLKVTSLPQKVLLGSETMRTCSCIKVSLSNVSVEKERNRWYQQWNDINSFFLFGAI